MEMICGLSNWRLTLRREEHGVVILRAVTCDRQAVLPDAIFGLPVTFLEDHALAPNARPAEGEQVTVTCGLPAGEWDNRRMESLTLPAGLKGLGPYALYGCTALRTLYLHDGAERWGGGCLMNCRSLERIVLTRTGPRQGPALAFLCGEIHDRLDVTVLETDGSTTRLIFPEFTEVYEENCPAHHFDYIIFGGGHPYHMGFPQKQLSLRDYDGLWDKYLREEHEPDCALQLAWCRLRWPNGLTAAAADSYRRYLAGRGEEAFLWPLDNRDMTALGWALEHLRPDEGLLHRLCDHARRRGFTEGLALLLEQRRSARPSAAEKEYDL